MLLWGTLKTAGIFSNFVFVSLVRSFSSVTLKSSQIGLENLFASDMVASSSKIPRRSIDRLISETQPAGNTFKPSLTACFRKSVDPTASGKKIICDVSISLAKCLKESTIAAIPSGLKRPSATASKICSCRSEPFSSSTMILLIKP